MILQQKILNAQRTCSPKMLHTVGIGTPLGNKQIPPICTRTNTIKRKCILHTQIMNAFAKILLDRLNHFLKNELFSLKLPIENDNWL